MKSVDTNHPVRVAAVRLLAGRKLYSRSMLIQEGLLQIYEDFCLMDEEKCARCDFEKWVRNWKGKRELVGA
jgi:hypothetical protein